MQNTTADPRDDAGRAEDRDLWLALGWGFVMGACAGVPGGLVLALQVFLR